MTNEQVYDPQLALRQRIAGILDRPSVYMGGPSKQNLKRADEIIAAIREDSRLMQAIGVVEPTAEEYAEKALGIAMDAYDEARDAARLEWVMRNVSGAEWRRLGVLYGDFDGIRRAIDAALSSPENRRGE